MRYLLLTRGMPLCGKTTWIKKYDLESYVLNPQLFQSTLNAPVLDDSGKFVKNRQRDKLAYHMLFSALEARMEKGEFIIIEDLHIAKSYCSHYKEMAKKYVYETIMVDFSNVPFETICKRNEMQTYKEYTTEELQILYNTLKQNEIPIKCKIIMPDDIETLLNEEPCNLNGYKTIHHIGDIHGSYHVLQQYLGTMKNDEFYIFLGDYIDRGFQNYEVLQFLLHIMDRKNVCLLEGNHEKWLWQWANNKEITAKEFKFNTQVELERKGFSKQDAINLYKKLVPYFFYRFHDKRVICTHGGISNMPKYPILLSATQSIQGVGSYLNASSISLAFSQNVPNNFYQVFGHRNKTELPMRLHDKSFLLESKVEYGGYLRTLQLKQHGFIDKSIRNTIFVNKEEKEMQRKLQKFFDHILNNKKYEIKNFHDFTNIIYPPKTPKDTSNLLYAFYPLVIDTKKWQIVARGYHLEMDKRANFSINQQVSLEKITFPLNITRKLFGKKFIVSYYNGQFYVHKDSNLTMKLPIFLKDKDKREKLIHLFKNQSHSILCLQTTEKEVYLLDVFANQSHTNSYTYNDKNKIANLLNIKTPKILFTIQDKENFNTFMKTFARYDMAVSASNTLQTNEIKEVNNINNATKNTLKTDLKDNNLSTTCTTSQITKENAKTMDIYIMESIINNEKHLSLSGFYIKDSLGFFFEIPTLYDYEMRMIGELIKTWRTINSVTPLKWINNTFRIAFKHWFIEFAKNNDWKNMPSEWIQNKFLSNLINNEAKITNMHLNRISYIFK